MSLRNIFHRRHIQSGIDVSWHLTSQEIQNNAASWRRLPIPWSHWRGGIHDDYGHARGSSFYGNPLGQKFRAFVMPDHFVEGSLSAFVGQRTTPRYCNCCYRTGVNNAFNARMARSGKQVAGAFDINFVNLFGPRRPQPVIGSDVKNATNSLQSAPQRFLVPQITFKILYVQPSERL